jgi:hypothetical protein
MAKEPPEDKVLRKTLSDIINGHSVVKNNGATAYVKHFGNEDQEELEGHYDRIYNKAKASGLPTEKEAFDFLKEQDMWTAKDESDHSSNKKYIEGLNETKKNLIIPSQIKQIEEDLKEAQAKLDAKDKERNELLAETCESYARNKSNDYSIYLSFYADKKCSKTFFSKEEFEELTKQELTQWFMHYVETTSSLSIENIKYLAISSVFTMYYNILGSKQLFRFFNKPIYKYSFYQLNLLNYAKVLNSILENVEKIPESVKKHPDQLIDFAEAKSRNKDVVAKSQDKQGFSVVGASKEDMGEMGVSDELSVSPFQLAKEKGSLTIEDFQNFS